jgi:hypothetical protein
MLRSKPRDNVFFEHELTAGQLLARFSGVRGPDLRDPVSVHKRRPWRRGDYRHTRGGANCGAN